MAKKATSGLSVADLEKMLAAKRDQLSKLQARHASLTAELSKVEEDISRVEGSAVAAAARPAKKRGRKKAKSVRKTVKKVERQVRKKATRKKAARRGRKSGQRPLGDYIMEAISQSKGGLTLQEIADTVLQQGYKSSSSNFKTVVYQTLYHSKKITRDSKTGNYILV